MPPPFLASSGLHPSSERPSWAPVSKNVSPQLLFPVTLFVSFMVLSQETQSEGVEREGLEPDTSVFVVHVLHFWACVTLDELFNPFVPPV